MTGAACSAGQQDTGSRLIPGGIAHGPADQGVATATGPCACWSRPAWGIVNDCRAGLTVTGRRCQLEPGARDETDAFRNRTPYTLCIFGARATGRAYPAFPAVTGAYPAAATLRGGGLSPARLAPRGAGCLGQSNRAGGIRRRDRAPGDLLFTGGRHPDGATAVHRGRRCLSITATGATGTSPTGRPRRSTMRWPASATRYAARRAMPRITSMR